MWNLGLLFRLVGLFSALVVAGPYSVAAAPRAERLTTFSTVQGRGAKHAGRATPGKSRKAEAAFSASPTFASLRTGSPEILTFERAGYAEVRYVSVRVLNTGKGEGRQIDLSLQVGDGLAFPLKGPKRLPPKGSAVYTSSVRFPAEFVARARVVARCATCRL